MIHADGYAGFNELFAGDRIVEAACWAHVRRKFFDVLTCSPMFSHREIESAAD